MFPYEPLDMSIIREMTSGVQPETEIEIEAGTVAWLADEVDQLRKRLRDKVVVSCFRGGQFHGKCGVIAEVSRGDKEITLGESTYRQISEFIDPDGRDTGKWTVRIFDACVEAE